MDAKQAARTAYEKWLSDPLIDEATKKELLSLSDAEMTDRFYQQMSFGTGGLRGEIGAGTNRMNIYTVRQATQGLANYILSQNGAKKGVAIAYDSRRFSAEFAKETALVLNANGITTYRFESLRPTPELSFAVRQLGCIAGVVITASHNPREYNGYKVYWEDGAQITPPHDKNIIAEVRKVTDIHEPKTMPEHEARAVGLYHSIGEEIDAAYLAEVRKQSIHPDVLEKEAKHISVVYTPLHGTGNVPVRTVLRELGFEKVYAVPEQAVPDGEFPMVAYPNPEDPKAWELALALAKEKDADIILATDPDADRLGVYAKDAATGEYVSFTGNMSGVLICEYILRERSKLGTLPKNPTVVETIVTTNMVKPVAKEYGCDLLEVLTGFKYIGEKQHEFEQTHSHTFVFGLEESYGCLAGDYTRDKDAIVAVMLLAECAAFYKAQGKTLVDAMRELYEKYGYYKEDLATITLKGIDGKKEIASRMDAFRNNPKASYAGQKVLAVRDYELGVRRDLVSGEERELTLPKSNVLYYELENDGWCAIRPSGTEPKIKFYCGVKGESEADAGEKLDALMRELSGE